MFMTLGGRGDLTIGLESVRKGGHSIKSDTSTGVGGEWSELWISIRDLLDLVHNVILIECMFGCGKPRGGGILGKGSTWTTG